MISNSSLHGPTSIIMLHSKPNIRRQSSIVLGNCALHLMIKNQNKISKDRTFISFYPKRLFFFLLYLDLSERDQKTLLNLRIQTKNACSMSEIAVCSCKSIHGCCLNNNNNNNNNNKPQKKQKEPR
jgi:hypothetical protein